MVKDRPIISAKYGLPFVFGQKWPTQLSHALFACCYIYWLIGLQWPSRILPLLHTCFNDQKLVLTSVTSRTFTLATPAVWKSLSVNSRSGDSFARLKRGLKCELFASTLRHLHVGRFSAIAKLKACAHGKEVARATCLQLEGCASCLLKRGGHTER